MFGEGASKTASGAAIVDNFTAGEIFGKSLGFNPLVQSETQKHRFAVKAKERGIEDRRTSLMEQFTQAAKDYNPKAKDKSLCEIREFNKRNPPKSLTGDKLKQSVKSRISGAAKATGGLYLKKSSEYLREEGRVADYGIRRDTP